MNAKREGLGVRESECSADIGWVDEFARSVREYVYVRERDSLLILMPNQAYKLNSTGLALMKGVTRGRPVAEVIEEKWPGAAGNQQVAQEVHEFFCDIRALVMGCLGEGEGDGRRAVETVPFERPHNTLPVLSEIALTYRCNLSCRFCYAGCARSKRNGMREMTTSQVRRVLEVIRYDAEVPSVSWTGGEPALREDIVELTGYATEIGMRVNLITNATRLTPKLVQALREAGLRSAQVSIEGPSAAVHDALTQTAGSFAAAVEGLRLLQEAGLHVHTNTTLNRLNAPHVSEMMEFAAGLGLGRLSMNMVIPCGSASDEILLTYTDAAMLVERARRRAREVGVQFLWYSPTPYCIYNPVAARLGGKSCAACDGLLSIAPNGDVLPCSSLPRSVGNLLRKPFDRVWNSRKALFWRGKHYAHRICRACEQFEICSGACPIYWKAFGSDELVRARRAAA